MSNLIPSDPNRNTLRPFNDFVSLMGDFFQEPWFGTRSFKIDVRETEKEYHVEADMPGVKKDEIDLQLLDGRLVISVNRDESVRSDARDYVHQERRFASMQRTLYLPDAGTGDVRAKLSDGVLSVSIPKDERASRTRHIRIDS